MKSDGMPCWLKLPTSLPSRGAWIEMHRMPPHRRGMPCRSPHGERGLKSPSYPNTPRPDRRSPHGERGLKYQRAMSRFELESRSPHGERGLKYHFRRGWRQFYRRSPHGERGLKFFRGKCSVKEVWSLPSRGAWIEIELLSQASTATSSRSPHGERGLKYLLGYPRFQRALSLPSRGAWIEISRLANCTHQLSVAPLTGSVD